MADNKIGKIPVPVPRSMILLSFFIFFAKSDISTLKLKGQNYTMLSKDDMEVLSSSSKHFLNTSSETMLGKVFGYFFGE